jgi:hypothetical protein
MNIKNKLFAIINLLMLSLLYVPAFTHAETAGLYLSPGSVSQPVGSNFTIYVGVNSGGNAINAIEATVSIPSNLSITGAGTGGSLCSIWVQQPTISGSSVSFKCGVPSGTTSSGTVASISVRANSVGTGSASIAGARVLAGPGLNVTGASSGGTYTVTEASSGGSSSGGSSSGGSSGGSSSGSSTSRTYSTASPTITSSSHSDQNAWSKNNSPAFLWTKGTGVTGFSYVFDQSSGTVPGTSANTTTSSISFSDKSDGVWYFHIRASGTSGWSGASHYRVQIDKAAPTNLIVLTEPKVEADKRPMVSFLAEDAASGIDRYEIKMDQGEFVKTASPFTPESIKSGDHVFTVRAYDKAGNMVEGSAKIKIKNIPTPKITSPANNTTLKLIQKLDISGTADVSTKVDLYFDGVNIARALSVNDTGSWNFTYKNFIMPGKHEIMAIAVKDGIESIPSSKVILRIDPSAVNIFGTIVPIYLVLGFLLVIIAILLLLLIWFFVFVKRKYDTVRERLRKRNQETELTVHNKFDEMEDHIRKDIQKTYEAKVKTPREEHNLEEQIESEIATSEKAVEETIEKEIKDL